MRKLVMPKAGSEFWGPVLYNHHGQVMAAFDLETADGPVRVVLPGMVLITKYDMTKDAIREFLPPLEEDLHAA